VNPRKKLSSGYY